MVVRHSSDCIVIRSCMGDTRCTCAWHKACPCFGSVRCTMWRVTRLKLNMTSAGSQQACCAGMCVVGAILDIGHGARSLMSVSSLRIQCVCVCVGGCCLRIQPAARCDRQNVLGGNQSFGACRVCSLAALGLWVLQAAWLLPINATA